jgi:hypothetical protein
MGAGEGLILVMPFLEEERRLPSSRTIISSIY